MVPDNKLLKAHTIQGFEETGFSVIIHVIEHFSYHTGQITILTKMYTEKDLGYYSNVNLTKLNDFGK